MKNKCKEGETERERGRERTIRTEKGEKEGMREMGGREIGERESDRREGE